MGIRASYRRFPPDELEALALDADALVAAFDQPWAERDVLDDWEPALPALDLGGLWRHLRDELARTHEEGGSGRPLPPRPGAPRPP